MTFKYEQTYLTIFSTSDWKIDQSSNIGRTSNLNEQVQASRTDTIGSSKEKGRNLEYEIQGFKQSFVGTRSFLNSETLIKSASGSVSVSNSVARQYGAKMKEDRPAFTTDFVKEIQFLNAKSLLVRYHKHFSLKEEIYQIIFCFLIP